MNGTKFAGFLQGHTKKDLHSLISQEAHFKCTGVKYLRTSISWQTPRVFSGLTLRKIVVKFVFCLLKAFRGHKKWLPVF